MNGTAGRLMRVHRVWTTWAIVKMRAILSISSKYAESDVD